MKKVGGATLVTRQALEQIKKCKRAKLEKLCDRLLTAHPEMASILVTTTRCLSAPDHIAEATTILNEMARADQAITKQAVALCKPGDKILTHSASGNVLSALLAAHEAHGIEVIVTESRPLLEGRDLARALSKAGLPITFIVDALAPSLLPECKMVWVGADAVADDFFVNKIGTLGIALAAQRLEIPFYVLHDPLKILPEGAPWSTQDHPPEEVWRGAPRNIRVRNPYFEKIPLFLTSQLLQGAS